MATDLVTIGFAADTRQVKTAEQDLNRLTAAGGKLDGSMSALTKTIGVLGAAFAAIGVAASVRGLVDYTNTWTDLNSRLLNATKSSDAATKALESITATARRTYSSLTDTAEAFLANSLTLTELGYSTERQLVLSEALNNALVISGTKGQQAASVMDALSKSFAAGELRGENFNSVIQRGGRIVEALANGLGVTTLELRAMAQAGELDTARVFEALTSQAEKLAAEADEMAATVGDGMLRIGIEVQSLVGRFDELSGASGSAAGVFVGIAESLEAIDDDTLVALTKTLELMAKIAGVIAVAAMAKYAFSLAVATKAKLLLNTQATVTVSALGMVTRTAGTATVAMNALGLATKVALGPVGIFVGLLGVAAIAFNSYAAETDMAKRSSADLKAEIEQLTGSMEKLTKAQAELLQVRIAERMEQIETSLSQMSLAAGASSEELQAIFGDRFKNAVVESAAAAETLNEEMKRLKAQSAELSTIINGGTAPAVDRLTKAQQEAIKEADKLRESFAGQALSLELQRQQLILSTDEFELLKAKMDAIAYGATPAMVAGIEASVKALQNLRNASKGLETLMDGGLFGFADIDTSQLDAIIDQAKDFGGAWSQAGSEIINAFGGVSAVIGDYSSRIEDLIDLQNKLTIEKSKYAEGSAEAAKADMALAEVQQQMFASNISAVGRLAGATAKAFKEQSKERQALHRLETAFAAIEIALAAEKAVANAVAAVANQGSGDPYTAFGRIAAMIGIMAGVLGVAGIAFSGGGGGGAPATNSGSGTVLGSDDPSASVSNSAAAFEDIALDQLAELRGIRDAMNGLTNGISQLATSLLTSGQLGGAGVTGLGSTQNASGIVNLADKLGLSSVLGLLGDNIVGAVLGGIFGSTKSKLIDTGIKFDTQELGDIIAGGFEGYYYNVIETTKKKLFGLSKKTSTRTETTELEDAILEQIGGIFVYLAEAVSGAVDVLGVDMVKTIESFNINLGSISFEGLSGEEIQKKLEDVISQQGDLLAAYVLPQIKEYQKIGEGALETLLRVSKEQVVFNDALEMIGQSLGNMSNLMRIDVAQSIITMMGGLEEFSDSVNLYFKEFFTESEQLDFLTKSLTEAMAGLGFELPMTREGFRALIDSLDLTTEAGQQAFAALMELVPGMAEYFKQIEKQTEALTDYEGAAKAALSMLQKSIQVEKDRAQAVYVAAQAAYAAEVERINGVKRAIEQVYETLQSNLTNAAGLLTRSLAAESQRIESEYSALQDRLSGAEGALSASFNAEKSAIQSAADLRIEALNMESDAVKAATAQRIESLDAEAEMARKVASDLRRLQEQFSINTITVEQALKAARRGDFSLAQNLNVSEVSASNFGSAEEFKAAQAIQAGRLNEIGQLAGSRATAAERTAAAAERQILAIQSASDAQIDLINKQIEEESKSAEQQIASLDNQLNELLGINTTALNLQDAIKQYQDAQKALSDFDIDTQREQLAEQQKQADLLMGIDNSVVSVAEAIATYQQAQLALDEFNYEGQISALDQQLSNAESMLSLAEKAYQDEIARLDAILLDGQEQLNALLGIDTSIMSLTDAVNNFNSSLLALAESMKPEAAAPMQQAADYVESELREELRQEKENNAAALRSIAKSSERTANIIQRMEMSTEYAQQ